MKIRAPAKINVYLRVVGRRKDGYHLLDTIMVPVSLYDEIEIKKLAPRGEKAAPGPVIRVTCDHPLLADGENNLAYRAAALLLRRVAGANPVHIHIRKRIPLGAGLGGGSSDAGATLVGLNRLFRLGFSFGALRKLAVSLGADVPFFIQPRPARARGIGERLTPLRRFPRAYIVILYPGFAVATEWVYKHLPVKLTKLSANTSITCSTGRLARFLIRPVNDLEEVVLARYPRVARLKERLAQEGAQLALVSGSGSSVFGVFKSRREAERAFRQLRRDQRVQAFLVRVLN